MNKRTIYLITICGLLAAVSISPIAMSDDPIDEFYIFIKHYGPPEDINEDGEVEMLDASLLVSNWGESGIPGWTREDINGNGEIEMLDASRLVAKWGLIWIVENP